LCVLVWCFSPFIGRPDLTNDATSPKAYAPFSHFFMKLFLAAPASGLPAALTALVAQLPAMHFFMNDVFAAPASGLPSLLTALLSQVSCAIAVPAAKAAITVASTKRLSIFLSLPPLNIASKSNSQRLDLT